MSVLLSPAWVAFVQIALALIAGYVCFILVKIVRDATKYVDSMSIKYARRAVTQSAAREEASPAAKHISAPTR